MERNRQRLRWTLILFFLALTIPTSTLVLQARGQLKWEAFHRYRVLAEELTQRIDQRYAQWVVTEDARTFTDYTFLNVAGDSRNGLLQRSELSHYPVRPVIPGTLGYFQIDHAGHFSTPTLPGKQQAPHYGVNKQEWLARETLHETLRRLLSQNRLLGARRAREHRPAMETAAAAEEPVATSSPAPRAKSAQAAPMESDSSQSAFDALQGSGSRRTPARSASKSLGRLEDLKLKKTYEQKLSTRDDRYGKTRIMEKLRRSPRKEQNALPSAPASARPGINMFESEVDALEFARLDSGHFVLYRKVWRDGQRYIQGLLIDQNLFIDSVIRQAFEQATVSQASRLAIAYQGEVLSVMDSQLGRHYTGSASELQGTLLLQARLSEPFDRLELVYSIESLPAGPGGTVLAWTALVLGLLLPGGFWLMYRLGLKQIQLAAQQQDFVSAVSHELKTPLTSIRMYGEMLREGWVSEDKRKSCYDYIYEESERLTRLINNVLQLARMNRNELRVDLKPCTVSQLLDTVRSKTGTQLQRAGFVLNIDCKVADDIQIEVDADYFSQIVINLVDNAIKFSARAEKKQIDIHCQLTAGQLQLGIRDYGPGIPGEQMRKIFQLFYRLESELTRETVGTGIGLALVQQLLAAMGGQVDVINQSPGAEFLIRFPVVAPSADRSEAVSS